MHNHLNRTIQILLILLIGLSFGCKSVSSVPAVSKSGLDYTTQKNFENIFFEANKQQVLKNKEKALELYTAALGIYPQSHATMYQLAKLFYQLDKYTEALALAEKTVNTARVYNHWYYGLLAQYYNTFGKYAESAAVFHKMIDNEPNVKENYTECANQLYNAKLLSKAVEVLKKMQTNFGIEKESSTRLDFVYTAMGEKEKAIFEMEKLVEAFPDNVQYKGYLSETYMKGGRDKEAVILLKKIIAQDPSVGKAHFALYSIENDAGKQEQAMAHLKNALQCDDISLQQKMQALSGYLNKLRRDTSLKNDLLDFASILEASYIDYIEPYVIKADIYGLLGEYEIARENIRKAVNINPAEFHLWSKLLGSNARLSDVDQQLKDTKEALELFPNVVELYVSQAYAYIEKEEYGKGVEIADEGLEIAIHKKDQILLILCKASAFEKQKMYVESDKLYEEILVLNPYDASVLNNYAYSLANRKMHLDKADSMIGTALKLEPSNPFFLDTKAWILYAKQEYEQAIKILNKCIEIDPNGEDYYRHAKACYEALDNRTMANAMQQKLDKLKDER